MWPTDFDDFRRAVTVRGRGSCPPAIPAGHLPAGPRLLRLAREGWPGLWSGRAMRMRRLATSHAHAAWERNPGGLDCGAGAEPVPSVSAAAAPSSVFKSNLAPLQHRVQARAARSEVAMGTEKRSSSSVARLLACPVGLVRSRQGKVQWKELTCEHATLCVCLQGHRDSEHPAASHVLNIMCEDSEEIAPHPV